MTHGLPSGWDAAMFSELCTREEATKAALAECSVKLNDLYATDGVWTEGGRSDTYAAEQLRHGQLSRELTSVREEIRLMRLVEPRAAKRGHESPLGRYLLKGVEGLDEGEVSEFMREEPMAEGRVFDLVKAQAAGRAAMPSAVIRSDDADWRDEIIQPRVEPTIVDRLSAYGGVTRMVAQATTATGNDWRIPNADNASQEGELLAVQGTAVSDQDPVDPGSTVFSAKTASSRRIRITMEMLQDSQFDIEGYANGLVTRRMGRLWARLFTVGDGANGSPRGVVTDAVAGIEGAANTGFSWLELVDLQYKVNKAYREDEEDLGSTIMRAGISSIRPAMMGRIGYLISDDAERICRRIRDDENRPIWVPDLQYGARGMLLGYPYEVSANMDAIGASKVPVLFGNFSYYLIRTVGSVGIYRFWDSQTAETHSIHILGFSRRDGRYYGAFSAGTTCEAVAKLALPA